MAEEVREKAIELLFATTRTLSVKREEGEDKRREMGTDEKNELYVYLILKEYLQLEKTFEAAMVKNTYPSLEVVRTWSEGEKEVRASLLEQIDAICQRFQKDPVKGKRELVFARLFVNVLLEQVFKPEYSQFIPDLVECYRQFSNPNQEDQTTERPVAVLLEIVLILLRTSSKTLRDSATQLFGGVCGDLEEEDVRDMLNVFWTNEGVEEVGEEEEMDSEEDMEITMDENGEEEEEEEEEENEEEDDDDDEEEESEEEEEEEEEEGEEKEEKEEKKKGGDDEEEEEESESESESEWENGVCLFHYNLISSFQRNSVRP